MLSEQQQAARTMAIGSSDAPIIAGVSTYGTPWTLYQKMTGAVPRYDEEETWEQQLGTLIEPVIAEVVAEREGWKVRRVPTKTHAQYPWMVAHLDYEIVSHPRGPGILELKRRQKSFSALPDDIRIQVAHQLAVTNRDWAKVAVLFHWGPPVVFDVERDQALEEALIGLESRFIERVKTRTPPPMEYAAQESSILRQLYPQDNGKVLTLDSDEARAQWQTLITARAGLADAETAKEQAQAWFQAQMTDAAGLTVPGCGSITWKTSKGSRKFDQKRFEEEHPDLATQYYNMTAGSRRFLIKEEKA